MLDDDDDATTAAAAVVVVVDATLFQSVNHIGNNVNKVHEDNGG